MHHRGLFSARACRGQVSYVAAWRLSYRSHCSFIILVGVCRLCVHVRALLDRYKCSSAMFCSSYVCSLRFNKSLSPSPSWLVSTKLGTHAFEGRGMTVTQANGKPCRALQLLLLGIPELRGQLQTWCA